MTVGRFPVGYRPRLSCNEVHALSDARRLLLVFERPLVRFPAGAPLRVPSPEPGEQRVGSRFCPAADRTVFAAVFAFHSSALLSTRGRFGLAGFCPRIMAHFGDSRAIEACGPGKRRRRILTAVHGSGLLCARPKGRRLFSGVRITGPAPENSSRMEQHRYLGEPEQTCKGNPQGKHISWEVLGNGRT